MSYDQQKDQAQLGIVGLGVQVTGTLTAATRFAPAWMHPVTIQEFSLRIEVAPTVTPTVIALVKRPTPGSATGEIEIGRIIIPVGSVVGTVYYRRGLDHKVWPGEEIVLTAPTVNAVGSITCGVAWSPSWDSPGNHPQAKMIASA